MTSGYVNNTLVTCVSKKRMVVVSLIIFLALFGLYHNKERQINEWLLSFYLSITASSGQLIQKFEETVFRSDLEDSGYTPDRLLSKWGKPIRVNLVGDETKRFREPVERTLRILSGLSGLVIHLQKDESWLPANIDLHITPPDQPPRILADHGLSEKNINLLKNAICVFHVKERQELYYHGVISIISTINEKMIRHCLIEEITQSLGLIADTDIVQPSIMSDTIPLIDRLPMNDKIMVRTLYDKRLKPGMTRDEAMPIVRKIIPELVAAVKERGEEALYQ